MKKHYLLIFIYLFILLHNVAARGSTDKVSSPQKKSSPMEKEIPPGQLQESPVLTYPGVRPVWINILPENEKLIYIIGKSERIDDEAAARRDAQKNAHIQLSVTANTRGLRVKAYYTEIYLDEHNYKQYVVYVLMRMDRNRFKELQEKNTITGTKR